MLIRPKELQLRTTLRGLAGAAAVAAVLAPAPASAATSPPIWSGSPVNGTWGAAGYADTVPGYPHHKLAKARNDWSVDLSAVAAGTPVLLYVAPSDGRLNAGVTTRVTAIVDDNTCRNGGGGDFVTVGIYYNGTLKGSATYAHIDRDPALRTGKALARWGARLGTVAQLSGAATGGSNCWTGRTCTSSFGRRRTTPAGTAASRSRARSRRRTSSASSPDHSTRRAAPCPSVTGEGPANARTLAAGVTEPVAARPRPGQGRRRRAEPAMRSRTGVTPGSKATEGWCRNGSGAVHGLGRPEGRRARRQRRGQHLIVAAVDGGDHRQLPPGPSGETARP